MAAFLILVGFLAFSRFGQIRLGHDADRPEFRMDGQDPAVVAERFLRTAGVLAPEAEAQARRPASQPRTLSILLPQS
jgi:BCCT, betaine/carnitine/choline family transporter